MSKVFFGNIFSVFSGALIAQLIPVAGTLVLARIFDPASFGIYSAWLGAVLFLGVFITCRFEASLANEADGKPRQCAVVMILVTISIMSTISLIILGFISFLNPELLAHVPMALLAIAVPTAALVATTQTLQNWAAADGRYRHLTLMRLAQAGAVVLLQIAIGLGFSDAVGLGFGYLLGAILGLMSGLLFMPISNVQHIDLKSELLTYWRKHRRFPAFSLPADTLNAAAAQLPVFVVAARFGAESAGLLAMAMRMLGAPMSLLAASVLDVFKRHAGKAYQERGECKTEYLHAFRVLCGVAAFAGLAIGFGAEPAFSLVFGEEWVGAGIMAIWLLPRFVIGFVASPLSYMAYVAGKQQLDLIWQIALLIMTLTTLFFINSLQWTLISYGLGYGGLYLVYLRMSYQFSLGRS